MTNHIMDHTSSSALLWLAITISLWLDASLQLQLVSVAAFSTKVSGRCSASPQLRRCQSTLLHTAYAAAETNRCGGPFSLFMSTKDRRDLHGEPIQPSTTTEQQLQKRFEEAMQRRKERRSQYECSASDSDQIGDPLSVMDEATLISPNEIKASSTKDVIGNDEERSIGVATSHETEDGEDEDIESKDRDGYESKDRAANIEHEEVNQQTSKRQRQPKLVDEDNFVQANAERSSPKSSRPPKNRERRDEVNGRESSNNYRDRGYHDEDRYSWDNPYVEYNDGMDYNDYDQGYSSRSTPACEWETYRSTSILFPPQLDPTRNNGIPVRPKAIIHFVGGTFFGSYPRKFYSTLLEDIACKCEAVVVATPIPLVLPGKGLVNQLEKWMFDEGGSNDDWDRRRTRNSIENTNPLDHSSLSETIQKEFNNAYRDVILDEYCSDYVNEEEVEDFMKGVPIVGVGHSLGARIQAISCSHPRISNRYLSMGKGNQLIRSGRDGMIYLGFANWGASSSIPGVATLDRTVRRKKQGRQEQDRKGGVGRRDDVRGDRSRRRRRTGTKYDARRRYSQYDRYDAEDLDLADVFSDVVSGVANGAKQIGEALTPESEDLEFSPTPNELWDDLSSLDGRYNRNCKNSLIVQFDQDPIDQGSRLARTLLAACNAELNSTSIEEKDDQRKSASHDVKFARLSGGHLTPVSFRDGISKLLPRGAVSLLSSSFNFILKQLDDERVGKSSQRQRKEVKDVADTVASYVKSLTIDA